MSILASIGNFLPGVLGGATTAVQNRLARQQADRHFAGSQAQQADQFNRSHAQQQAQFQQGYDLQRDKLSWNQHISKHQMQYKAMDAAKAGIHPSVAAGGAATGMAASSGGVQPGSPPPGSGMAGTAGVSPVMMDAMMMMQMKDMESQIAERDSKRAINEAELDHIDRLRTATTEELWNRIAQGDYTIENLRAATNETQQRIEHNEATHQEALSILQARLFYYLHSNRIYERMGMTREQMGNHFVFAAQALTNVLDWLTALNNEARRPMSPFRLRRTANDIERRNSDVDWNAVFNFINAGGDH